jgi:hypothetical protein
VCDGGDCGQADRSENSKVSMCHCECPYNEMHRNADDQVNHFNSNFGPSLTPPIAVLAPPVAVLVLIGLCEDVVISRPHPCVHSSLMTCTWPAS